MSDVFYTPPVAQLSERNDNDAVFFTVSLRKYKSCAGLPVWPVARCVLGLVYLPSLFAKINRALKDQGKAGMPYWAFYAGGIIFIALAPSLIGFVAGLVQGVAGLPYSGPAAPVLLIASTVPLLLQSAILVRVQSFINRLNNDPAANENSHLTLWNAVWMVIGIVYWGVGVFIALNMASVAG